LIGMTRVMARELGEHRITVNAVAPAQVATPGTRAHSGDEAFAETMRRQAIQEFVTPEHFAGLVSYLASPERQSGHRTDTGLRRWRAAALTSAPTMSASASPDRLRKGRGVQGLGDIVDAHDIDPGAPGGRDGSE